MKNFFIQFFLWLACIVSIFVLGIICAFIYDTINAELIKNPSFQSGWSYVSVFMTSPIILTISLIYSLIRSYGKKERTPILQLFFRSSHFLLLWFWGLMVFFSLI